MTFPDRVAAAAILVGGGVCSLVCFNAGFGWLGGLLAVACLGAFACVYYTRRPDGKLSLSARLSVRLSDRLSEPLSEPLPYRRAVPHRPYQSELDLDDYGDDCQH